MSTSGTSYVDIDDNNVQPGWLTQKDLVVDRFAQTLTLADNMQVKVDGYLADMARLADEFEMPKGWDDDLEDIEIRDIVEIDPGSVPSFGDIDLPTNWPDPEDFPILGALQPAPAVDLSIDEPDDPLPINPSISHEDAVYTSELWLAVYNKVLNDIQNGGTGLEPAVEQAIYDRAIERQRKVNDDQYIKLMAAVGANGFDMPPGALNGVQQTIADELLRQAVEINEKIFINQAELAQKNTHFMVERAGAMEGILREFHNNRENRSLEAKKAAAELVVQVYSEDIKAYISKWEGQKLKLQASTALIDSVLKENSFIIEGFKAKMEGVVAQIDGVAKQTTAMVEGYKGEVAGYSARVDATTAWYKALSEEQKAYLGKAELELKKAIAEIQAELSGYNSFNELKKQLTTDMANIASQSVASALNAVNASASMSYSGSESASESYSHGDSVSESHSFDETPT